MSSDPISPAPQAKEEEDGMSCACTGRCQTWPYTCSGAPPEGWHGIYASPYLPPPRLPTWSNTPAPHGCICPPGSETTCQGPLCPRRPISPASSVTP